MPQSAAISPVCSDGSFQLRTAGNKSTSPPMLNVLYAGPSLAAVLRDHPRQTAATLS